MARNEEKALTLFSKWQTFKKDFHSNVAGRRPLLSSDCDSLIEAEKWRREIINDITKKIAAVHNASLGEHRIREINDEINKLLRQKHHWETRIRELGGDVSKGRQFYDVEGKELPGAKGYKYYGAAQDLPGVRELFAEKQEELELRRRKRTRGDLFKFISPDYFGFRDDDDGILVVVEAERERQLLSSARNGSSEHLLLRGIEVTNDAARNTSVKRGYDEDECSDKEDLRGKLLNASNVEPEQLGYYTAVIEKRKNIRAKDSIRDLRAHVILPCQKEIEAVVVEKRKQKLLRQIELF